MNAEPRGRADLALDNFHRIVFFTGAGLSAECGLPTYRGEGGIWHKYNYEDFACQRAFDRDPEKVWEFHDKRREMYGGVEPSQAHRIIAEVQQRMPGTAIVTQNIDGLHQRAGAEDVIELHGSLWRVRCRCHPEAEPNREIPIGSRTCPTCGAWRRPDIVWFEDPMLEGPLHAAMNAIANCDLLVSIGTSGVVYPAAELPRLAYQGGARRIEINPEETPMSRLYDMHIRGPASASLVSLWPDLDAARAAD